MSTPTPGRYVARPPIVDAIRFDGTNGVDIALWAASLGPAKLSVGTSAAGPCIGVASPNGMQVANPGDWVVRDAAGNLTALGHAAFDVAYAPATA